MNIVHIQRRPFPGQFSVENLFSCLRDEMRDAGYDVERFEVPYFSKGLVRRILNCWSVFRGRADINHITGDIHYVAMFLPRNRTILTIHDCEALERFSGLKRWVLRTFWFDLPIRRAKIVTVISEESRRQLKRHVRVGNTQVIVVPDTVSPIFRPCLRTFNAACPRILHVGTKQNKNLSRLVESLREIHCHLHIVGRLSESQRREINAAGVDFSTAHDLSESQMYAAYCDADLVSFVSTSEGFGLPILEANAVGRPVVTSNLSSMPEVAGDAACLVDPYDISSIRSGITRVIEDADYQHQLIDRGFENARRFRSDTITRQYLSLYHAILGEADPASARALNAPVVCTA